MAEKVAENYRPLECGPAGTDQAGGADGRAARARRRVATLLSAALVVGCAVAQVGCDVKSFIDPTVLADPRRENRLQPDGTARAKVQIILDELDLGVTRTPRQFADARDIRADDLEVRVEDYIVGPGDLLRVSIYDYPPGQTTIEGLRVSDTGYIDLPEVRRVRIEGLTEAGAGEAIERALQDAGIIEFPSVSVLVAEAHNRTFRILGNVQGPGRYAIPRSDYRLLDAIAEARGSSEARTNSEYAFVIRSTRPRVAPAEPDRPDPRPRDVDPLRPGDDDPLAPGARRDDERPEDAATFASAAETSAASARQPANRQDAPFEFQAPVEPVDREVIRVPLQELLRGQLRYNIVLRADDMVILPVPETGEYYVGGEVNVSGAFALFPGRRLTLKQAIISARELNQIAIPQRTQLIRRIDDQDVFVRVDLAKIFTGEEPDIFIMPNDTIMVGTNLPAPFVAAIRNGFRVTYGFGFLYDRNFARPRQFDRF